MSDHTRNSLFSTFPGRKETESIFERFGGVDDLLSDPGKTFLRVYYQSDVTRGLMDLALKKILTGSNLPYPNSLLHWYRGVIGFVTLSSDHTLNNDCGVTPEQITKFNSYVDEVSNIDIK